MRAAIAGDVAEAARLKKALATPLAAMPRIELALIRDDLIAALDALAQQQTERATAEQTTPTPSGRARLIAMAEPAAWPAIEPHQIRPLKRSEYDRMIELGMFEEERVELLRGMLVKMSPQRAPHASTIERLTELLAARLRGRWRLRVQLPLALSDDSEPEPDVAVVALGNYDAEHPTSALLVIEVAETTLRTARSKAAVYASSRIGEYWIVNLDARTVEIYSSPDRDRYAEVRTLRVGDTLQPLALADVAIEVAEILPKS